MSDINRKTVLSIFVISLIFLPFACVVSAWANPMHNRQQMMERIETIKMWKLMDTLNLNSETALKVFPIIKEMDQKKALLMQKKRALMRQLRDQINGKAPQKGKTDTLASQIFNLTEQLCAIPQEAYNKLKPVLTEKQLGQYLLFQQRFRRELLHRWFREDRGTKKRGHRPGMRKGPGPMNQPPQG